MTPLEFKKLLNKTRSLTRWDSSKKCFGHFIEIEKLTSTKKVQDRIYEFYCLLRILEDLRNNYLVKLIPSPIGSKTFPQSPGKKENFAYFELTLKSNPTEGYQICFGTRIGLKDVPDKFIAPDISIQNKNSSLQPEEKDVKIIYDAKYKFDSKKTIKTAELDAFMHWVSALEVKNANIEHVNFVGFSDLIGNCLLTNGNYLKNKDVYCKKFFVKQISNFGLDVSKREVCG